MNGKNGVSRGKTVRFESYSFSFMHVEPPSVNQREIMRGSERKLLDAA